MANLTSGKAIYSFFNKKLRKRMLWVDDDGDDDDNRDYDKYSPLVCAITHNVMITQDVIGP
jgi:hypothetical protein